MFCHNYTIPKFQHQTLSGTTFCGKSATGVRVLLKDPFSWAVLCTRFDVYAMLDGVRSKCAMGRVWRIHKIGARCYEQFGSFVSSMHAHASTLHLHAC